MLIEDGVNYTTDEKEGKKYKCRKFNYSVYHKGRFFEDSFVYCFTSHEMLQLVNHWNRKSPEWKYVLN